MVGVELSDGIRTDPQEVFVVHAYAPLSERGRLRLARLVVEQGWPIARPVPSPGLFRQKEQWFRIPVRVTHL